MKQMVVFALMAILGGIITDPVWAQLSPGNEMRGTGMGGETILKIKNGQQPGQIILRFEKPYAVFLNEPPSSVVAHLKEVDYSGKGMSYVVDIASNEELVRKYWCIRGAGADYDHTLQQCSSLATVKSSGAVETSINIKLSQEMDEADFAINPVVLVNPRAREVFAWGSHPANARRIFWCKLSSGEVVQDMLTLLHASRDSSGRDISVRISTDEEAKSYQERYPRFCAGDRVK